MIKHLAAQAVGIGVRSEYNKQLVATKPDSIAFLELAPENWIGVGGARKKLLLELRQRYPMIAHGLCLSLGGPTPLNQMFLKDLNQFMLDFEITYYSEHLSYCSDESGYLYDLMPIPFTEEAVYYVADRIKQVQDSIGQRIAVENVSYYCAPGKQLSEIEFINAVIAEADCELLLDVNNIYVNSVNHRYDAYDFLHQLPLDKIAYIHIAGHYVESEDLLIDTHGELVCDQVWQLLSYTYQLAGYKPTVLERDNDVPPLEEVLIEVDKIHRIQEEKTKELSYGS